MLSESLLHTMPQDALYSVLSHLSIGKLCLTAQTLTKTLTPISIEIFTKQYQPLLEEVPKVIFSDLQEAKGDYLHTLTYHTTKQGEVLFPEEDKALVFWKEDLYACNYFSPLMGSNEYTFPVIGNDQVTYVLSSVLGIFNQKEGWIQNIEGTTPGDMLKTLYYKVVGFRGVLIGFSYNTVMYFDGKAWQYLDSMDLSQDYLINTPYRSVVHFQEFALLLPCCANSIQRFKEGVSTHGRDLFGKKLFAFNLKKGVTTTVELDVDPELLRNMEKFQEIASVILVDNRYHS